MNTKKYLLTDVLKIVNSRGIKISYAGLRLHILKGLIKPSGTTEWMGRVVPCYDDDSINNYIRDYIEYKKALKVIRTERILANRYKGGTK